MDMWNSREGITKLPNSKLSTSPGISNSDTSTWNEKHESFEARKLP